MALRTDFTERLSIEHPVVSAPMGGAAGGALAAAVSEAGGLGLIGAGSGAREVLEREAGIVTASTSKPWGIGFLLWSLENDAIARALDHGPAAILLSFGDPAPYADEIRSAGVRLIVQVTDMAEARRALEAGADVLVAQGNDAGGHAGQNAVGTMSFVPSVVDMAGSIPVLAAGGIADGRSLAAALALGASGAMIGTRFQATHESLVPAAEIKALLDATGADTETNRVLDIARGSAWPARYPARTLRNAFLDAWRDREAELRGDLDAQQRFRAAAAEQDPDVVPIWAGQALDRVTAIASAADVVAEIVAEADRTLTRLAAYRAAR
ncbi:NAD(P)H-dependent flavin oxidoreductase [Nocardia jejuensis]|uniref:NAD(P)H-dependent flavin oxidoreductase n=1 Tax=Nocardia jejuensis TaxID=328049 RepID=UPI0008327CA7|nr:nitronate monooxygenase [Nocardia jejuensis]